MNIPERLRVAPRKYSTFERVVRWFTFCWLTGVTGCLIVGAGIYIFYVPTVPQFESIMDYQPKLGTRLYSLDNQLIAEFSSERRVPVPYEKIPPLLIQAFVSAEDKRFFEHQGLDFWGIFKAVVDKGIHPDSKLRGASTITQQVAKSLLATEESYESATARKLGRKIREAILAYRLEQVLSKQEIVYIYVTQIFLGHQAYGVQAAAEHYFDKNVWELNLAEMATLAGLPQRPSDYSPNLNPESALARRRYVLSRMQEDGYITTAQQKEANVATLVLRQREEPYLKIAPYFAEQVRRELIEMYGERSILEDGLQVYTTLNIEYQAYARAALANGLHALDERQGYRGPLAQLKKSSLQQLFVERYREQLGLRDPAKIVLKKDATYLGIVKSFAADGKQATLDIAGEEFFLPLAGMIWARKPNPVERVDMHYLEGVHEALTVGDVIAVKLTTKEELQNDAHAWRAMNSLPDSGVFVKLVQEPLAQGALMTVDPRSGYVLAQVGGYNFDDSSFNRAVQACREPGSAFKPVVYSAAIDKFDYTASTLIDDKPLIFDDPENALRWKPNNAEESFRGQLPLRTCLKDSINTPAIRIAEAVGIEDILKNAERLGIASTLKRELGTALGSSCTTLIDLMRMYVTLNRYGSRQDLHFIRRVVDRFGNVLLEKSAPWDPLASLGARIDRAYEEFVTPTKQALDPQTGFVMVSLLKNVITSGTGMRVAKLGVPIAGKTGTTDDSYDAWFMGFTRDLVTGVWVGHDKKERPLGVDEQGGRTAAPIWLDYMTQVLLDYTGETPKKIVSGEFVPPVGIVRVFIDPETGLLGKPKSPRGVWEYYRAGTQPTSYEPDKSMINPDHLDVFGADSQL